MKIGTSRKEHIIFHGEFINFMKLTLQTADFMISYDSQAESPFFETVLSRIEKNAFWDEYLNMNIYSEELYL